MQVATACHECAQISGTTRSRWRWASFWLIVVAVLLPAATTLAQESQPGSLPEDGSAAMPGPPSGPAWYMVIDRAGILDDSQERSAIDDAWRLTTIGIPTQVVTELAGLDQAQASRRAEELRTGHHIESGPGANDGILIYAAVNARARSSITLAISYGRNVVPRNGLSPESITTTFEEVMLTQLKDGHPARAIVYGMRELIYLEQFEPASVTQLTGWRSTLSDAMRFIAPVVAVACAGAVLYAMTTKQKPAGWLAIGSAALLTAITAIMSVLGRSAPGIVVVICIGSLLFWQAVTLDRPAKSAPRRTVAVTPRPPRGEPVSRRVTRSWR